MHIMPMASEEFFSLSIQSLSNDTRDSTRVSLKVPPENRRDFLFKPGQYINIKFRKGDSSYLRTYSICSSVTGENLEFAAKHIKNGVFSEYIKEKKIGDILSVSRPAGHFVLSKIKSSCLLLIAAGSGITPIISIAKSFLESSKRNKIILLFCNKKYEAMMFREDLQDLKDSYISRFLVFNFFTQEYQEADFFYGRINSSKIEFLIKKKIINAEHIDEVFICGPVDMTKSLGQALERVGFKKHQVRSEIFYAETKTPIREELTSGQYTGGSSVIEIRLDGVRKFVSLAYGGDLIDSAKAVGIILPFACRNGMCATCRCKVLSGKVQMRQNFSLEDWELKQGYILSCQLRAIDDKVILDFDNI